MKTLALLLSAAFLALLCGCDAHTHDGHGHEAHEHGKHDHEAHEHGACSHEAHASGKHDHEAHAHGASSHEAHGRDRHDPEAHAHATHANGNPAHSGTCSREPSAALRHVSVSLSVQKTMGLKTVRAAWRDITAAYAFTGRYELAPQGRESIASPVAGRVHWRVHALQHVKKGDLLFTVTSPDLVSRAHEIDALEKRLNVYRSMGAKNAALENELAVKRAERRALLVDAEEANGVVSLRAPADGLVSSFAAENGSWCETGTRVVEFVKPQCLRFKALVPAAEAAFLKDGQPARVGAQTGEIRLGIGDETGLVPVYVVFSKPANALAGARDTATTATSGTGKPAWSIPTQGIVEIALQPTVFIRDKHDATRFTAYPVTPLRRSGDLTAVEELPFKDADIVCEGAYELKLALAEGGPGEKTPGHYHADGTFHAGEH